MTAPWKPPLFASGLGPSDAWNAIIALSGETLPLDGSGAVLVYRPDEKPSANVLVIELKVEPQNAPVFLHVADFPFRTLFNADLGMSDLGALPEGLRQALFDGVLGTLRVMLPSSFAERIEIRGQGLAASFAALRDDTVAWFGVSLRNGNGPEIRCHVGCRRDHLIQLLPDLSAAASPAAEALAQQLTVPVDTTLGTITLRRHELRVLEPGAVVVLAETVPGTLFVRAGQSIYSFTHAGEHWQCAGPQALSRFGSPATVHETNGHAMDEDTQTPLAAAESDPAPTDDLPIAIDFDLGRTMVPLSAVSRWQAGALVDLSPPQVGEGVSVTIRANGEAVGTGDIVRVDDRIAVRITRFLSRA